ncbi:MAG: hypothetical protein ACR2MD_00450 [Aridibacter sp.]
MDESAISINNSITESTEVDALIIKTFAKVDNLALGVAVGTVFGLILFFATNTLILKGGDTVGQTLIILSQYFIGYTVSFIGSFIGFLYGFLSGFVIGWLIAFIRNLIIKIYLFIAQFKARMVSVNKFID